MKNPISLKVSREAGFDIAFVVHDARKRTKSVKVAENVNVDFAEDGAVLAIELIALGDADLAAARAFSAEHGLGFPASLLLTVA